VIAEHPDEEQERSEGVRISDRRRIDPVTFQARQSETPAAAPGPGPNAGAEAEEEALPPPTQEAEQLALAEANARAEEALADAKRVAAEYANYRRRVDRDRDVQRDVAVGSVLAELLPILDDIARAQEHGELTGGFKSVADALQSTAEKFGVEPFGTAGEPFDPAQHEAMTSQSSDEVSEPTVDVVYQIGYRLRGRLLRPARVGVVDNG
jgi:molecular chaperone GrpE